jgi:hypothetical protein
MTEVVRTSATSVHFKENAWQFNPEVCNLQNLRKLKQAVQKLLHGGTQTERQTDDLISLLSFLESSLKTERAQM